MRKLISTLLCLACLNAVGQTNVYPRIGFNGLLISQVIGGIPLGTTSCATSDTTIPHDELLEGWQNNGPENTWTYSASSSFLSIASTTGYETNKPTGACDRALLVTSDGQAVNQSIRYDRGSGNGIVPTNTTFDVVFHLYVSTTLPDGKAVPFFSVGNATTIGSSTVWYLTIDNSGGNTRLRVNASAASSFVAIPTGQWVKVKVHSDVTADSSYIQINDGTQTAFTRYSTNPARYVGIGGNFEADETLTYFVDLICVNTP